MADDDLLPVDIPKPRRKKLPSTAAMKRKIEELSAERNALIERCKIAEQAAVANLGYAQAAREAMEELSERIMTKLDGPK